MTPKETALILRLHNAWRRGYENAPNMTEPKLLGEVIDSAISLIEQHDELLAAKTNLRQQVAHMTDQLAGEKSNVELANQQCDELLAAAEAIEINSDEVMDFDDCMAILVPMDDYHRLMEAIASAKELK